jgi:hypothetical protein
MSFVSNDFSITVKSITVTADAGQSVSGHGFSPTDQAGGLASTIDGREYQLSFHLAGDGNSILRATYA